MGWAGLAQIIFVLKTIPEADEQDNIDYPENNLNHSMYNRHRMYSWTKSLQVFEAKPFLRLNCVSLIVESVFMLVNDGIYGRKKPHAYFSCYSSIY